MKRSKRFKRSKTSRKDGCVLFIIFFLRFGTRFIDCKKVVLGAEEPKFKKQTRAGLQITGGSSGIGKATAIEACKLGADVTILARNEKKLEEAVEEIKTAAKHPNEQKIQHLACDFISVDVTKSLSAVDEVIESIEATAGPAFLLVNCVGASTCGEFETITESDFRRMMDVNYFGTIFPSLCVAKRMKSRKSGHIVVTAPQDALLGIYGMTAASPSRFALRGFAESLSMELKPHNVAVTVCFPPNTDTPGFAAEQKCKVKVTSLISKAGELFRAEDVARRLLSDALQKKFLSSAGLEGFVLTTICAGMSPVTSLCDAFMQVSLMGLLRIISVAYHYYFQRVIAKASKKEHNVKKTG